MLVSYVINELFFLHYKEIKKMLIFGGQKLLLGVKIYKRQDNYSPFSEIIRLLSNLYPLRREMHLVASRNVL